MQSLAHLDDDALLHSLHATVATHRSATAAIVAHLAEVDERRLHLRRAFPSLFQYCVEELAFSEDEACRRIEAARLSRRFPRLISMLDSGQLSLSVIGLLKERLTNENAAELLDGVAGASVRRAKEWLAARFPGADVAEAIRRMPVRPQTVAAALRAPVDAEKKEAVRLAASVETPPAPTTPRPRAALEPLSQDRFVVRLTISRAARDKLEHARNLARHRRPDGNLEGLFEDALDALLRHLEKTKLRTTTHPRAQRPARAGAITSATRREVVLRDGARCSFVAPEGRRCDSQAYLEFDHVEPAGLGGTGKPRNVRLLCRAHNHLAAERIYGKDRMERARRSKAQVANGDDADS